MSVMKMRRKTKTVWRVHWREGSHHRTRHFNRKADAVLYDADVKRRKQLGDLHTLTANRQTLAEYAQEWFQLYAIPNLAQATQRSYATLWDAHALKRVGGYQLRELTPETITRFRNQLEHAGVGPASTRRTLILLQGMLERAVEWQRITTNPAKAVKKPKQARKQAIRPLAPTTIEHMRRHLLTKKRLRDATLISVLAYAGLRPGEALALTWNHIQDHTILVERAIAFGEVKDTKTGQRRTVLLLAPLAHDLAEWRLASGRPAGNTLVFPGRNGEPWTDDAWRSWRRKVFQPAATAAGAPEATPYHLRHSYISLLIAEGMSVVEVARQAGHSPTITLTTYAHIIDELARHKRCSAEAEIRQARNTLTNARTNKPFDSPRALHPPSLPRTV
jgi:integrase